MLTRSRVGGSRGRVVTDQRFDFLPEAVIARARFAQERFTASLVVLKGSVTQVGNPLPPDRVHPRSACTIPR